jgi:5-hydroxyisourate hydrolase-like protein (transthyretin family)
VRVASDTRQLDVDPGSSTDLVIDVVNTTEVIDGVSARIIGLPEQFVTAEPALLPLFPDAAGRVTLSVAVPNSLPAGRHPLTVEVVSHGARLPSQFLDVDLDVAPRVGMSVSARPRVVRARRGARFVIELVNDGNIPIEANLVAVDADRAVRTEFVPTTVRIEPGAVAPVLLHVRGPRMFTGGEVERAVTVEVTARALGTMPEAQSELPTTVAKQTVLRLRQRPLISRGLLTALILASIVALWAGAFLLGLTKVFSGDAMTKQAPASFFLPKGTGPGGNATKSGSLAADATGGAPADSLPKTGQVPPGTGGALSGTVIGAANHQPVGRILVQAWRVGRNGPQLVSSAATQSDGTYTLGGLFPTSYYVKFSAAGFNTVWYPGAPSRAGGKQVAAPPQAIRQGVNAVITGHPADVTGTVDPGDVLKTVTTTVTARPLFGSDTNKAAATTTTDAAGRYHLVGLPAPGTYEFTFVTQGYRTSTIVDDVTGGEHRLEPTVVLGAGTGAIGGTVRDGHTLLGGATVSTTLNGKPLAVTTPTTGQVGTYLLDNLQTPGNYVLTFSAPGHGSVTRIVDLAPGQTIPNENVVLTSGTGSISGTLVDGKGNPLGGADVTVGGTNSPQPVHTMTLTAGAKGTFAVNGLAAPGVYTLTFNLDGYAPTTVRVTLGSSAVQNLKVTLTAQLGSVSGSITAFDPTTGIRTDPFVGATVTATDGTHVFTVASSGAGGALPQGGYLIDNLQPGTYSVTVSAPGMRQQTGIVTIAPHQRSHLDLTLVKTGG